MEQHQPDVTHVHLMVAIETMKETVGQLKKEVQTLNNNHEKQLERLTRAEIRIAQGMIIAVVVSFALPLLINAVDPQLRFGSPPTHTQP
jgi:hypothetical protein